MSRYQKNVQSLTAFHCGHCTISLTFCIYCDPQHLPCVVVGLPHSKRLFGIPLGLRLHLPLRNPCIFTTFSSFTRTCPSQPVSLRAVSSQLRHISTIGKKLLNSNISSTCSHNMANFGLLTAEIGSGVWGTSANFNGFRVLPSLLQRRRSPEANQTLHSVWPSHGLVH